MYLLPYVRLCLLVWHRPRLTRLCRRHGEIWEYDGQAPSWSQPVPTPRQDLVPTDLWVQSDCRFGTTCGAAIPIGSVAGVYAHLSQYHPRDPWDGSDNNAPIPCSWDDCGQVRESTVALCEHIVAQHINPYEPEGCMNLSLTDNHFCPAAAGTLTYGMPDGYPLPQEELHGESNGCFDIWGLCN